MMANLVQRNTYLMLAVFMAHQIGLLRTIAMAFCVLTIASIWHGYAMDVQEERKNG